MMILNTSRERPFCGQYVCLYVHVGAYLSIFERTTSIFCVVRTFWLVLATPKYNLKVNTCFKVSLLWWKSLLKIMGLNVMFYNIDYFLIAILPSVPALDVSLSVGKST